MNSQEPVTRRDFLRRCLAVGAWAVVSRGGPAESSPRPMPPVALFDKVCVQAGLSLEQTVDLVASSGLEGVDCAVRPRDRIEPERVREDLPRYAELLRVRGKRVWLLTTAILSPDDPHAREVLETARGLGVKYYRVGFLRKDSAPSVEAQIRMLRDRLKALAAWNRELGMCALLQNHSPSGASQYVGGDLREMLALVDGFPSDALAVAFDLGHALLVHGDEWRQYFERLRPHVGVVYVKDTDRKRRFVPFGEGEFARTRFFSGLREQGYDAPFSLHIEFDWGGPGPGARERLESAVRESLRALRTWWAMA